MCLETLSNAQQIGPPGFNENLWPVQGLFIRPGTEPRRRSPSRDSCIFKVFFHCKRFLCKNGVRGHILCGGNTPRAGERRSSQMGIAPRTDFGSAGWQRGGDPRWAPLLSWLSRWALGSGRQQQSFSLAGRAPALPQHRWAQPQEHFVAPGFCNNRDLPGMALRPVLKP